MILTTDSLVHIFQLYNHSQKKKKLIVGPILVGSWNGICVAKSLNYTKLIDKVYEAIGLDKSIFDMVHEVIYTCGGRHLPKTDISIDEAVNG